MDFLNFRIELLHPLLVHFPIALLITGAFARLILAFVEKRTWANYVRVIYLWSLVLGCVGLAGAFFSGDEAEDVVNRIICDPTITHDHEDFAKLTLVAAGISLFFALVQPILALRLKAKLTKAVLHPPNRLAALTHAVVGIELVALASLIGLLTYTSHLGGTLVYEQGAGYLKTPNEQCD